MKRRFLIYFIPAFLAVGCQEKFDHSVDQNRPLYSEPITVALNLENGYKINQLTGDPIKPIINSLGDTVKTGIPIALKASIADPSKISVPGKIKIGALPKISIENDVHQPQEKPEVISGDTVSFQSETSAEEAYSVTYKNIIESIATPISVTGKTKPIHEPQPVRASRLRFKDGATSNIQYMDVGQGLSYSFVHCMLADRNGYLWFGLDANGLCKYDGVNIINYTEKDGLKNNNVTAVAEDNSGNLWIGSDGGLSVFDGKNITEYSEKGGLPAGRINSISKDKKGNMWFVVEGIGHVMFDGKNFIGYAVKKGLPGDIIHFVFADSRGAIWFSTDSGPVKFDGKRFIYFHVWKDGIYGSLKAMVEDRNGNIWFGTAQRGLLEYNGKNIIHYSKKQGLSGNTITSMIEDKKGNLWVGTRNNGINKFDGNDFTVYGIEEGVTNNAISQIIEDKNGNIWFGTTGGGVNKLNEESFLEIIKPAYLGNSRVRPIMKDIQGNLWLGTEAGGLYKYDGKSIVNYSSIDALPIHGLRSMLADKKGNLWFGYTDGGGLYKYDNRYFLHFTEASGISGDNVMSILEDRNGVMWLGTFGGGINRFDGNTFSYYSEKEKFSSKIVFTILEDKKGNLWFGTAGGGVVKYDGNNFITFSEKEGFYGRAVTSIAEDEEGNLWFGTLGAGLCKFDGKRFTYFSEREGLSYNDVWSLKEDSTGQFWAGTDKGLSLLIPRKDSLQRSEKNYSIYSFGLQDGLKGTDFNLHSVCIDNSDHIWWGTGKALITRDLKIPFKPSGPHSLSLVQIAVNGQFCDFRNLSGSIRKKITFRNVMPFYNYPEDMNLAYDQNHLVFHFSAIDWSASDKIKYSYRLIGSEANWSNPSSETFADYRNLRHGEYELQVKAIGQSQVWTAPISYHFIISPPWWLAWWFKLAIVIASLALIFFIARFIYLYQLRKQKALLEKQLAVQYERQRISAEMHDEIGAGLSGIMLMTEMAKMKSNDEESASEIEKIYHSVDDISSKMKEVIWSLSAENDTLSRLISYLQKQARLMMENYPGKFFMKVPDTIPEVKISGDTRRHIHLIVKEALHNIIKHSGADKVNVIISYDDQLRIIVADNGIGISESENEEYGNGMKNMRQRIRQLGGSFLVESKEGVILTFKIPLK